MNTILPVPIYYLVEPDFRGLVMENMARVCFSFFSIRFHSWVLKLGSSFFPHNSFTLLFFFFVDGVSTVS